MRYLRKAFHSNSALKTENHGNVRVPRRLFCSASRDARPRAASRTLAAAMMLDAHAFGMAERLRNHNGYLDSLIEMVPAKYYFPPDPDEMAKKFQKHVNKPATQTAADKLQRKMESSERKRAKLDPEQLTVPQQQQHIAEQEERERERDRAQQRRRAQREGESDGEDEDETPGPVSAALSGYNTGDASSVSELKARPKQNPNPNPNTPNPTLTLP